MEEVQQKNPEEIENDKKGFVKWVKEHKDQLALAGVSVAAVIAVILGLKNKDSITNVWLTLKDEIKKQLDNWNKEDKIMFKFTIPTVANHYLDLYDYECVVRIVALSGGYDIDKAVELLTKNNRMIASFSRALLQDLNANQTQEEFDTKLNDVIVKIYNASIS